VYCDALFWLVRPGGSYRLVLTRTRVYRHVQWQIQGRAFPRHDAIGGRVVVLPRSTDDAAVDD